MPRAAVMLRILAARPVCIGPSRILLLPAGRLVSVVLSPAGAARISPARPVRIIERVPLALRPRIAPGRRRRRRGNRSRRQRGEQRSCELTRRHDARRTVAGLKLHGPAGKLGQRLRHRGDDLPRSARLTIGDRSRRQGRIVRTWPASGERGVEQPAEAAGVSEYRVLRGRTGQRGIDAEPDDLHLAGLAQPDRARRQAQVSNAGRVRRRQCGSRLGDHASASRGLERPGRQQVSKRLAGRPLHDDVGAIPGVFHIEDLGQSRIGEPACRPGRRDNISDPGVTLLEGEDGDGSGQSLVDRLPGSPPRPCGDSVL